MKHPNCLKLIQKATLICSGAMLLQAGGCAFDPASLATGLITSVAGVVIQTVVFGVFNLI